ncbi:unnamed protein product, partial [Gulo gulo]
RSLPKGRWRELLQAKQFVSTHFISQQTPVGRAAHHPCLTVTLRQSQSRLGGTEIQTQASSQARRPPASPETRAAVSLWSLPGPSCAFIAGFDLPIPGMGI